MSLIADRQTNNHHFPTQIYLLSFDSGKITKVLFDKHTSLLPWLLLILTKCFSSYFHFSQQTPTAFHQVHQCSFDLQRCNMGCPKSKAPRSKGCRRSCRSFARTWRRPCASRPQMTPTCSSSPRRGSLCPLTSVSSPSSPQV